MQEQDQLQGLDHIDFWYTFANIMQPILGN